MLHGLKSVGHSHLVPVWFAQKKSCFPTDCVEDDILVVHLNLTHMQRHSTNKSVVAVVKADDTSPSRDYTGGSKGALI